MANKALPRTAFPLRSKASGKRGLTSAVSARCAMQLIFGKMLGVEHDKSV
jgi:hypothetical protein